jgi:hypothetical protein
MTVSIFDSNAEYSPAQSWMQMAGAAAGSFDAPGGPLANGPAATTASCFSGCWSKKSAARTALPKCAEHWFDVAGMRGAGFRLPPRTRHPGRPVAGITVDVPLVIVLVRLGRA